MRECLLCGIQFAQHGWHCPACQMSPQYILGYPAFSPELARANTGFQEKFFAELAIVEAQNFWFRARNRLIVWVLQQYFPNLQNFFEIGCGTGFVLSGIQETFPQISLSASDVSSAGLPFAGERVPQAELFQMDARHIPFKQEFDVIGAFDVLEHIQEDETVLAQIHEALRPGGGLLLTVPQHPFLWSQDDEAACHVRRYTAQELKQKVEQAGFRVAKSTSFVSLLFPLMVVSRFKRRNPNQAFDEMAEFKISSLTNTLLEKVMDMERLFIRSGLTFPFGGSLLLVGNKKQ